MYQEGHKSSIKAEMSQINPWVHSSLCPPSY